MPDALKTLPLQTFHADHAARMGEFAGWHMPVWYSGAVNEIAAVRHHAGVFDISHMGRFHIQGDGADAAISTVFSRDFTRLAVDRSIYALACDPKGGILDDLMIYRLAADRLLVVCNAANHDVIGGILEQATAEQDLTDVQSETVFLAVQGPEAWPKLASVLGSDTPELKPRGCAEVAIAGEQLFFARTGYTGEDGFEVMAPPAAGERLLRQLGDAGVSPCGLAARDVLRLEASLPLYGLDIDQTTTPWEAGLGWSLHLDHDFTGRDTLAELQGKEDRRLVCLLGDGPGVFRSHHPVHLNSAEVTMTTSGGFSPTLDRSIGMAYLPNSLTEPGTALEIDVRGRKIPCHVVSRPFYRSESRPQ